MAWMEQLQHEGQEPLINRAKLDLVQSNETCEKFLSILYLLVHDQ